LAALPILIIVESKADGRTKTMENSKNAVSPGLFYSAFFFIF
jgi:hypothetical protein